MSIFGVPSDASGLTPADTTTDDTPVGLTDQGDSVADDADVTAVGLDTDSYAPEAVRDPAGLSEDESDEA